MPILLLIDDAPLFLELERSFVRRPEFELVAAEDGAALIRKAIERTPDLVIAPAVLSDMTGADLCHRFRAVPALRDVPILLHGDARERHEANASPADAFVVSPWGQAQMLAAVRSFCPVAERGSERAAVSVKVVCGEGRESYVAFTKDISATGLFLKGASTVGQGATLRLRLTLPGAPQPLDYDLKGEVVRRVPRDRDSHLVQGIGLRFLDFPLENKVPLARFVRKHPGL